MDIICFVYVSVDGSRTQFIRVYVADALANVPKLVSVVRMAAELVECSTE
jgi:hypothetical protein